MSSIIRATTTSGLQITPDNSGSLQLQTNGTTTAVTIDTSQRVGIGTASPTGKLQVSGAGGAAGSSNLVYVDVTSSYGGISLNSTTNNNTFVELLEAGTKVGGFNADTTNNVTSIQSAGGHALGFNYNNTTEAMRINSSGKLVMASVADGTLGTIQAGITANTGSTNAIICAAANSNGAYPLGARGESTNQGLIGFFNSSDTVIGSVTKSGNNVAYNTSSDYRLKENITPMTEALSKVLLLKPVTYTWKEDGLAGQGFIAHELQEVIADAVYGKKDELNKDGTIKAQGVDTSFLVATLTAAIQEQQAIINDLKARIETLEAK